MEIFHLYNSIGMEAEVSPIEFYGDDKAVQRYSGLTEAEAKVYDELWEAAEGGAPLSDDLIFGTMEIKADKVTWKEV